MESVDRETTLGRVIEAVRRNPEDREAVTALVAAARPFAVRVASNLVPAAAVDDVAQDATLEMLERLPMLRHVGAFHGWLRLIVRKHADRHRRQLKSTSDINHDPVSDDPTPHELAERNAVADMVRDALAHLHDKDRVLLDLKYVAEWDDSRLAELLGITRGAVRKRLFDARRRLRPHLAEHFGKQAPPTPQEKPMPYDQLFGSVLSPNDLAARHIPPSTVRPARPDELAPLYTGFPVIDVLVPVPRGGVTDWRAGSLYLINELIGNLAAGASAALIAVGARRPLPNGIYHRFHRLIGPTDTASLIIVIDVHDEPVLEAVHAAGALAAALAEEGTDTILALDAVLSAEIGVQNLRPLAGLVGDGSVTVLTVTEPALTTLVDVEEPASRDDAEAFDAVIAFTTSELVRGMSPPVDLEHSWSRVADSSGLPARQAEFASAARELLLRSAKLRSVLSQPFDHGDDWSGHSARHVPIDESLDAIAPLLTLAP